MLYACTCIQIIPLQKSGIVKGPQKITHEVYITQTHIHTWHTLHRHMHAHACTHAHTISFTNTPHSCTLTSTETHTAVHAHILHALTHEHTHTHACMHTHTPTETTLHKYTLQTCTHYTNYMHIHCTRIHHNSKQAAITQPVNQHWPDAWHHSRTQAMCDKSSDSNQ